MDMPTKQPQFSEALAFLQYRGWQFIEGKRSNDYCKTHKKRHPIGFLHMFMGIYHGFDTEQEVIDWVDKLRPNAI